MLATELRLREKNDEARAGGNEVYQWLLGGQRWIGSLLLVNNLGIGFELTLTYAESRSKSSLQAEAWMVRVDPRFSSCLSRLEIWCTEYYLTPPNCSAT